MSSFCQLCFIPFVRCCSLLAFGGIFFFAFAERSPPPPRLLLLFTRSFLSSISFCTLKDFRYPRQLRFFTRSFLPLFSCLVYISVLSTCYLIPVTCSVPSSARRFVFVLFSYFRLSVLSCALFACDSLLSCAPRVGTME